MVFTALRALQAVALIILIGLTARHVSYMVAPDKQLPKTLAATLALVSEMHTYSTSLEASFRNWQVRNRR